MAGVRVGAGRGGCARARLTEVDQAVANTPHQVKRAEAGNPRNFLSRVADEGQAAPPRWCTPVAGSERRGGASRWRIRERSAEQGTKPRPHDRDVHEES